MDTRILLGGCLGGGGGSLTGTFIQPSPLGDLKKTPFEAGQATVKISWRRNTKRFLLLNYSTIFRSWCKNGAVLKLEHEEGKFWIRDPFLECPGSYWARKPVAVRIQDGSLNSFADNVMKLSFKKQMDRFVGKDSCLHSLDFGLNVWFRNRPMDLCSTVSLSFPPSCKGFLHGFVSVWGISFRGENRRYLGTNIIPGFIKKIATVF